MTPEQTAYYTRLGLESDVKHKAGELKQAMIQMQDAMNSSSGYTMVRFHALIETLGHKLTEFEAAIAAKEAK